MKIKAIICLMLMASIQSNAQKLIGKITDQDKKPLPYSSIYKVDSWIGATSNKDGYYSLNLEEGRHIIEFRLIGYKTKRDTIYIKQGEVIRRNISLIGENYELNEVEIAYGEDPAVGIIRNVIKNKETYLRENNRYISQNFTKSVFKFAGFEIGDRFMGFKVTPLMRKEFDSIMESDYKRNDGYFYTSESETMYYRNNDKKKEVMISSRVSGDPKGFSFNFSQVYNLDFYENLINLNITDKLFISPFSTYAFTHYRYFLIGTYNDNNLLINKIKIIPKNKYDNCFYGYVYIIDSLWRIQSLDLSIKKENNLMFFDSINFQQTYSNIEKDIWKPTKSTQLAYGNISILGMNIYANLDFNSIAQSFDFNPLFQKDFFNKELISINKDANKKDSLYWIEKSPIPINNTEIEFYRQSDSAYWANNNIDTLIKRDSISNRFRLMNIFTGYTYNNSIEKYSHSFNFIESLAFNTVMGWNIGMNYKYSKDFTEFNKISLSINPKYGFSDKEFRINTVLLWNYNIENLEGIKIAAGYKDAVNISGFKLNNLLNTFYTEVFGQNYMKIYSNTYLIINHYRELFTGMNMFISSEISQRQALVNYAFQKWTKLGKFTSNNPLIPNNDNLAFDNSNLFSIDLFLEYQPGMKYYSLPHKTRIKSKYPILNLRYKKAIPINKDIEGLWADYDLIEFKLNYTKQFGKYGRGNLIGKTGKFLNTNNMILADYKHYNGNRFHLGSFSNESFRALPYYKFSTNKEYIEFHYLHSFNRYIFNKLPLLRKTELSEELGFHLFSNEFNPPYMEISFGIKNIFKIFSLNYSYGFQKDNPSYNMITISLF